MFFKGTRYTRVETAQYVTSDGRTVQYVRARIIETPMSIGTYTVESGERLDNIAHAQYRDSQRYWRICDANEVIWPNELVVEEGAVLLIPSSGG